MLSVNDLKVGTTFVLDGAPYQVLEAQHLKMAQRRPVMQTKLRNLITGNVQNRQFAQSDMFAEADIERKPIKFIYNHRDKFIFSEISDPSKRFELSEDIIGEQVKFLKPNFEIDAFYFEGKIINVALPIKAQYKVLETPPGVKGNTVSGGTKTATIEGGAQIQVPLFVNEGETIVVNTQTGLYIERA